MQNLNRKVAVLGMLLAAGCTLITEAGDRQVDPNSESTLDFTFTNMDAHPQLPLDVALVVKPLGAVDQKPALAARARIILPPRIEGQAYPDERLLMRGVRYEAGEHTLLFYVDDDDNYEIRPMQPTSADGEHIWTRPIPAIKEFTHLAVFQTFTKDDYTSNRDVVLEIDPARVVPWVQACPASVDQTLEVKIIQAPASERPSQLGYYKNHGANPPPMKSIRLQGIADMGSEYTIQVIVNGTVVRGLTQRAGEGDFAIPFDVWYPLPGALMTTPGCPK